MGKHDLKPVAPDRGGSRYTHLRVIPPLSREEPLTQAVSLVRCGRRRYCRAEAFDPDLLAPLRGDPATAGIFSDFDGTLLPIVADPELAEPLPGIVPLLEDSPGATGSSRSSRAARSAFSLGGCLRRSCWPGCMAWKCSTMANSRLDPEAERWRPVVSAAATRIRAAAPSGVLVEPKGLSVTCHYRANPALEPQVTALTREVVGRQDWSRAPAASPWSCFPRFVRTRARSSGRAACLQAACYLGDDLGDLAAFAALDQLAARGIAAARIAVRSDEAPAELLQAADMILDAPEGAAELLQTLL